MEKEIVYLLKNKHDVVLVAPTDSGKTFFVINKLIPELKKENLRVAYFENGDCIDGNAVCDVVIFDEAETLFDQTKIEEKEGRSYLDSYLKQVGDWESKYKIFKQPAIFIVSRIPEDAKYLATNLPTFRGNPCRVFVF